mmetsp:Transcript_115915/g.322765  ORF Transcript_115915/g.322765 Transcript_115915/m.322765 type:complete len:270 (+) Transcript_115915:65-874(+)
MWPSFVATLQVAVASTSAATAAAIPERAEREACQFWQQMACLLDVLERSCAAEDAAALLRPGGWESAWLCCCPRPYQACHFTGFVDECLIAVDYYATPLLRARAAAGEVGAALQQARGALWRAGGLACQMLGPEQPHTSCSHEAPNATRSLARGDLFCEMVSWQWENLGDGNADEFRVNDCRYDNSDQGRHGLARKGQQLGAEALAFLENTTDLRAALHQPARSKGWPAASAAACRWRLESLAVVAPVSLVWVAVVTHGHGTHRGDGAT